MAASPRAPGALPAGRSRDELLAEVTANLAALRDGATVVLAVSGGPDSTALAFLVDEARADLDVHLAHVRHGLRRPGDDALEAALVARQATWLGRPLHVLTVEVHRGGAGIEAAARDARYAALRSLAAEVGAVAILTAHHADDQAETVVLRVARGTGVAGLAAMAVRSGDLVRPLLRVRGVDLRRFVAAEGLESATDPMNEDTDLARVRVRREVLPALARVGPDPVGALTRLADLARSDDDLLARAAHAASLSDVPLHRVGRVAMVASGPLRGTHPALARRIALLAFAATGTPRPTAGSVARLLEAEDGAAMTLPGPLLLRVERGWHVLAPVTPEASGPVPLPGNGRVLWSPADLAVTVVPPPRGVAGLQPPLTVDAPHALPPGLATERLVVGLDLATLGADAGVRGPALRHRRPGDRLRTAGGSRRVGDLLAEAGLPRAVRERWPVLAADGGDGAVLWVPGVALDVRLVGGGAAAAADAVADAGARGGRAATARTAPVVAVGPLGPRD